MSSNLFSTKCYIKREEYNLRLYVDNVSNKFSFSTIDDLLLSIEHDQSTSDIDTILNSIQFHFESLTAKENESSRNNDDTIPKIVSLNKLINIKPTEKSSDKTNSSSISESVENFLSEQTNKNHQLPLSNGTQIDFNYIDVSESFMWSVKQLQLEIDSTVAQQLCLISTRCLSKLKHRPRSLLVFVNSNCGKGKGRYVYEEKVLPLFEKVHINVKTIYTERANHARDYILEESVDNYDGLICVGGDGMFSELCHSLLLKTMKQGGRDINDPNINLIRPNIRIGIIPAGSTDAVVFGTTGHNDPITSALQIMTGQSLLIDIATIHNEKGFVRFLATMLAYGFFVAYFGPLRYILSGVFQFIRNQSYYVELTITQASEKSTSIEQVNNAERSSSDNSLRQREIHRQNSNTNEKIDSRKSSPSSIVKRQDRYKTINCLNMPCRCDNSRYGMSPTVHLGDGSFDIILVKRSWRIEFFQFLHQIAKDGRAVEDLSNVERFRATEVVIHPIVNQEKEEEQGNWACDGELFKAKQVRIRAHHQILNLFATGIRLDQVKKINKIESRILPKPVTEAIHWIRRLTYQPLVHLLTSPSWWQCLLLVFILLVVLFFCYYFFSL